MSYGLGISAFYHDSAAVLIKDGRVLFAAEEERFSRSKHDNGFPERAIAFVLKSGGIRAEDLDWISYYEKPLLKFERLLDNFACTYPYSFVPFSKGVSAWLGKKIHVEKTIRQTTGFAGPVYFIPHHLSHAASSFYPSPFDEAAILTVDGVGEYQTTGIWHGRGRAIRKMKSIDFPHSLGLFYSTLTSFLGFKVNDDEYKVMGLAAYGKPALTDELYRMINGKDDGSFRLDLDYFAFPYASRMWSKKLERLLGSPRRPDEPVTERHADIAASVQRVTEDIYFKMLNHAYELTGSSNVCISGGVGLNALANGKIYSATPFRSVYIFGASGDSGAALGSALFSHHSIFGKAERHSVGDLRLGSEWSNEDIEAALKAAPVRYRNIVDEDALLDESARMLSQGKVIGWFQDRMEFGPRALGSRSILAATSPRDMKEWVNMIKIRELFRPFAGSILEERSHEYFDVPEAAHRSPFMNFCFQARKSKRAELAAIVHEDGSTRIQTVGRDSGRYRALIEKYAERTGIPCILNTSFNLKGEPIVETPEQAITDLLKTGMDALVIGNFIVKK